MLAVKSTLAVEMFPEASFVTLNTIVAVPEPTDSALVIGGVSFAGDSVAVKVGAPLVGLVDDEDEPHPAAHSAKTTARTDILFIEQPPSIRRTCGRG